MFLGENSFPVVILNSLVLGMARVKVVFMSLRKYKLNNTLDTAQKSCLAVVVIILRTRSIKKDKAGSRVFSSWRHGEGTEKKEKSSAFLARNSYAVGAGKKTRRKSRRQLSRLYLQFIFSGQTLARATISGGDSAGAAFMGQSHLRERERERCKLFRGKVFDDDWSQKCCYCFLDCENRR